MSKDVVFDESRPFYPRPTTDASPASLVDPLSFLLIPDAPSASLPIPRSTLPSSVSSSEAPPVVSVYSRRGARLLDVPASSDELSSDVPSSSFIDDVPSPPPVEPPLRLIPLRGSLLDVVTDFAGHPTVTLLRLS
jgi:hypothetical protein